ncbi:MAG: DUF4445 domain-containing protein [Clostridia bacterium]|nr:DUF4445 domain-containing protein [Clostridia bacterium]
MNTDAVTLRVNGKQLHIPRGSLLSEFISGEAPCGGRGSCGKCRVLAFGCLSPADAREKALLSAEELAKGYRLACMTRAEGDCEVRTLAAASPRILTEGTGEGYKASPEFLKYGVAVDLGTTTLAAKLFDREGREAASAACLNPQSFAGADVITRIGAALAGESARLAEVIRRTLNEMITGLCQKAKVPATAVGEVLITGNTAMLYLLTGTDPEPLSRAPFAVKRRFGESLMAGELNLFALLPQTPVYLPPCISAFVGADTVCAVLADGTVRGGTRVLADIGTNGEIFLCRNNKFYACSMAAGPVFEGVGISCGMRGETGAVDRVELVNGKLFARTIGGGKAVGICGSGLVDAVACLLDGELLDESGYLDEDPTYICDGVALKQADIRAVQLAKSAVHAGIVTLLSAQGLKASDLDGFSVAGGFGNYLNMRSAARIGLLPAELARTARPVGNAALQGAERLLLCPEMRDACRKIAGATETLELGGNPLFAENYMMGMFF